MSMAQKLFHRATPCEAPCSPSLVGMGPHAPGTRRNRQRGGRWNSL